MKQFLSSLSSRDRLALSIGLFLLLCLAGYGYIIQPLEASISRQKDQLRLLTDEFQALQALVVRFRAQEMPIDNNESLSKSSLLSLVDSSSKKSGIKPSIKKIQPEGASRVRVYLEQAPFTRLISWLADNFEYQDIKVLALSIRRESRPGMVSGVLLLERG